MAQGACPDIKPQLQAATKLLEAGSRDKIKEEQELAKSYRLNLIDRVLEREVFVDEGLDMGTRDAEYGSTARVLRYSGRKSHMEGFCVRAGTYDRIVLRELRGKP